MRAVDKLGGWPGKKIPLPQINAYLSADPQIVFRFDTFGDNINADPVAGSGNGINQVIVYIVLVGILKKMTESIFNPPYPAPKSSIAIRNPLLR